MNGSSKDHIKNSFNGGISGKKYLIEKVDDFNLASKIERMNTYCSENMCGRLCAIIAIQHNLMRRANANIYCDQTVEKGISASCGRFQSN